MRLSVNSDEHYMKLALEEAKRAYEEGEVPIGAVVVANDIIIARAHNQSERLNDVTAHAEIIALTAASEYLGSKYLNDCRMYVTVEPCVMCAGALRWAQLGQLIYGAEDNRSGFTRIGRELLHPKTDVLYGIRNDECRELVKSFFKEKR